MKLTSTYIFLYFPPSCDIVIYLVIGPKNSEYTFLYHPATLVRWSSNEQQHLIDLRRKREINKTGLPRPGSSGQTIEPPENEQKISDKYREICKKDDFSTVGRAREGRTSTGAAPRTTYRKLEAARAMHGDERRLVQHDPVAYSSRNRANAFLL